MRYVSLEDLIKIGNLILESRNSVIFGIRKKPRMDPVGQLGVPTLWLSPYCQQEDYSSRRCFEIIVVMGKMKDASDM